MMRCLSRCANDIIGLEVSYGYGCLSSCGLSLKTSKINQSAVQEMSVTLVVSNQYEHVSFGWIQDLPKRQDLHTAHTLQYAHIAEITSPRKKDTKKAYDIIWCGKVKRCLRTLVLSCC